MLSGLSAEQAHGGRSRQRGTETVMSATPRLAAKQGQPPEQGLKHGKSREVWARCYFTSTA